MDGVGVHEHEVVFGHLALAICEHERRATLIEHEELEVGVPVELDATAEEVDERAAKRGTGKAPRPVGMALALVCKRLDDVGAPNHAVSTPLRPSNDMSYFSKYSAHYSKNSAFDVVIVLVREFG